MAPAAAGPDQQRPEGHHPPPTRIVGPELGPGEGQLPAGRGGGAPPTAEVVEVAPTTVLLVVVTPAGQVGSGSGGECLVRLFSVGSVQSPGR